MFKNKFIDFRFLSMVIIALVVSVSAIGCKTTRLVDGRHQVVEFNFDIKGKPDHGRNSGVWAHSNQGRGHKEERMASVPNSDYVHFAREIEVDGVLKEVKNPQKVDSLVYTWEGSDCLTFVLGGEQYTYCWN